MGAVRSSIGRPVYCRKTSSSEGRVTVAPATAIPWRSSTPISVGSDAAPSSYGTENAVTPPEGFEASLERLPPGTGLIVIDGGNHAGFGHYGPQAGDGVATIDREEQQRQTAETVLQFVRALP